MNTAENFAEAYADAVVRFVESGELHHVNWSARDDGWFADPADAGSGSDDQDFLVGDRWQALTGRFELETDPRADGFSVEAIREAVRSRLMSNGVAAAAVATRQP
jgi:hypothetical protein